MPTGTLPGNYGTLSVLDTLAANFQTIAKIGEDTVWEAISMALSAHNRILNEIRADMIEPTTDRLRRYGVASSMQMDEYDEFGTPDAQKIQPGVVVGFPLRKFGSALQWTRTYFLKAKGNELAAQVTGMLDADAQNIIRQMKRAVFTPTNYTFVDKLVDNLNVIPLPVKAFVNADGLGLPPGPNGEVFNGATHNHYLGSSNPGTLVDADLTSLLNTVLEHYASGEAVINISQSLESTIRTLTPNFQQFYDPTVRVGANITFADRDLTGGMRTLDVVQIYNRQIGTYRGAEVWVRPWMPAGYCFCWLRGQPKPICWRYDEDLPNDLTIQFEDEQHPLRARVYERNFGLGVWNRTNGAVLDTLHASYTTPTIT